LRTSLTFLYSQEKNKMTTTQSTNRTNLAEPFHDDGFDNCFIEGRGVTTVVFSDKVIRQAGGAMPIEYSYTVNPVDQVRREVTLIARQGGGGKITVKYNADLRKEFGFD